MQGDDLQQCKACALARAVPLQGLATKQGSEKTCKKLQGFSTSGIIYLSDGFSLI